MRRTRSTDRRGNVLVIAAVSFTVLCGFAALVVDLGYVGVVEAQLQTATDAGALAGAKLLDGTAEGLTAARAAAVALVAENPANGETVVVDPNPSNLPDGDVVLGIWADGAFTASVDPLQVNAVAVTARDDDLVPFFSKVAFGTQGLSSQVRSVALAGQEVGAGEVPWYLPFGLPDCLFDTYSDEGLQDISFVLSPPGIDNTGWASIGETPTASWVRDHFATITPCMQEWASTGDVEEPCAEATIDDSASLNNGEQASGLQYIASHIGIDGIPWDESLWGTQPAQQPKSAIPTGQYGMTYVGPIPVFDSGSAYCTGSGGSWNTTEGIEFFVWAVLYDVVTSGGAAQKTVYLRLDLDSIYDVGDWPGGGHHGVTATTPPALVQ
ncbi:pilus assembly protein TadG-related protein [Myxococcota bacterium]|nr:pilus assembly protein TadG-related protein [Myxococcota bacterium]